jgi:glycosyltransferase involved in cell wall biosynthesis
MSSETKKSLFHVVEAFGGGVFSSLSQLCRHADLEAFDITVVYSLRGETPEDFREHFDGRINFVHLPMCREISPLADTRAFLKLLKLMREKRPDVVHLHSSKAGVLGRAACRLAGIRNVFYSPRGFSFIRQDVSRMKKGFYYFAEKAASFLGGRIIALSTDELLWARRLSPGAVLVPNSVDMDVVEKARNEAMPLAEGGPLRVGISGRITYARAPWMFRALAEALSGDDVRLLWIGDGELRKQLEASRAPIEITGWKNREEALKLVAGLDIYVQTSLWEGMPNSVLEAMALGKPVVATDIVGNRDLVRHGETGFLASGEESFAGHVRTLAKDAGMRKRFGEKAKEIIMEGYEAGKVVRRLEALYSGSALPEH